MTPTTGWPNPVKVKGEGPGGLDIAPKDAACSGGTITLEDAPGGAFTANKVQRLNPLAISWFVSTDSGNTWKYVGTSKNEVFVVLGTPGSTPLWRTAAKLATQNGGTDATTCLAATWSSFAGPANVKEWDQTAQAYSKPLYYYNTSNGAGSTVPAQLLLNGDGQCRAWAYLLAECLRVNNVPGCTVYVYPPDGLNQPAGCDQIGVINISPTGTHYPPPFAMATGDLDKTPSGIPAQNKATPGQKLFAGHWIIKADSTYYDPSYGVKYTGPTPAEPQIRQNVAVYGKWFGGHVQWMRPSDDDSLSLILEDKDQF